MSEFMCSLLIVGCHQKTLCLSFWLPPKPMSPCFSVRLWYIYFSPIICYEKLSGYHDWCLDSLAKKICIIDNFFLGYHIFMGPLRLVFQDWFFFFFNILRLKAFNSEQNFLSCPIFKKYEQTVGFGSSSL